MLPPGTIGRVLDYYFSHPEFNNDLSQAGRHFFGLDGSKKSHGMPASPEAQGWFAEWFVYHYFFPNGRQVLEDFIERNPYGLPQEELKIYDELQDSRFSLFEVLWVRMDEAMGLRDVRTDKEYAVQERKGTRGTRTGNLLFGRVVKLGDHWELVGSDGFLWDIKIGDHLREKFRRMKGELSPKTMWELERTPHPDRTPAWRTMEEWMEESGGTESLAEAEAALEHFLARHGLKGVVGTDAIKEWIARTSASLDFTHLTMLAGLLDVGNMDKRDVEEFIKAVNDLYSLVPQEDLGGKSPSDKAREDPGRAPDIIMDEVSLPPHAWYDHAIAAHRLMQKAKFRKAIEEYDQCFEEFLRERTTTRDVWRQFANKAVTHLALGQEYAGRRLLEIALALNPNYDFALDTMRKYKAGEFKEMLTHGLLKDAAERMKSKDHPMFRWDFDEIRKEWPLEKILTELSTRGINLTENEFQKKAGKYASIDDFTKGELEPRYTGAPDDEDLIWMAAYALWDRWGKDCFAVELLWQAIEALEHIVYEEEGKKWDEGEISGCVSVLERYAADAPKEVFRRWREYAEFYYADTLIDCCVKLFDTPCEDRARALAKAFQRRTGYAPFALVEMCHMIAAQADLHAWRKEFDLVVKNTEEFTVFPYLMASDALVDAGAGTEAEECLLRGLTITREREAKGTKRGRRDDSLVSAYERLYDWLEDVYVGMGDKEKAQQAREGKKAVKARRAKLEEKEEEPMDEERLEKAEERMAQWEEERFRHDPAWRYYEFLKPFKINFATAELTTSQRTAYSLDGRPVKVGRNDPCPCGSGKKYKRCCGR